MKTFGLTDVGPNTQIIGWAPIATTVIGSLKRAPLVKARSEADGDFVDIDAQVKAIRAKPGAKDRLPVALRRAGEMLYGDELPTLKALRLKAGLSQEQFAVRMRTSQATVSKWESGSVDARGSTMDKIAAALGVRVGLVAEVLCRSCKAEDAGNV